jgi:hypothetical protein
MKWMIPLGAALLMLAIGLSRRGAEERPPLRKMTMTLPSRQAAPPRDFTAVEAPSVSVDAPGTASLLGFDASTAQAFDATRQVVQAELEGIQQEMGREFAGYPVDLPDFELQRIHAEIHERHRPDRDAALARLEVFLDARDDHRRFRENLEAWAMDRR